MSQYSTTSKIQPWKSIWPPSSPQIKGEKYGKRAGEMLQIDGTSRQNFSCTLDDELDPQIAPAGGEQKQGDVEAKAPPKEKISVSESINLKENKFHANISDKDHDDEQSAIQNAHRGDGIENVIGSDNSTNTLKATHVKLKSKI